MSSNVIRAPWSDEEVVALTRHQLDDSVHPYTCENRLDHVDDRNGLLVPTTGGWTCPECRYVQLWAWYPLPEEIRRHEQDRQGGSGG